MTQKLKTNGHLSRWCKRRKIKMYNLSKITGLSRSILSDINKDPESNVSLRTMTLIADKTFDFYGDSLTPDKYLSKKNNRWLRFINM